MFLFFMGPPPDGSESSLLELVYMFLIIFFIFWIIVIRPQKKHEHKRKNMLANLKKGDQVITQGGMVGKVVNVKDTRITLKLDENSNMKATFLRHAIIDVIDRDKEEKS